VIGTVAGAIGRGPAFSAVVVLSLALIAAGRRLPLTQAPSGQGMRHLWSALADRRLLAGMWLVALPAAVSGSLSVLGSLRLHALGAGAVAIGATFLGAAAVEAVVTPAIGRFSDRRGRMIPLRAGLSVTIVLLVCFTLPQSAAILALLVVATAATLGGFWAPAMAMMAETAEGHGLDQALAAALMNLAWAGGAIVGSGAGGAIAKAAGDGPPMFLLAAACGATLLGLLWRSFARRQRAAARAYP